MLVTDYKSILATRMLMLAALTSLLTSCDEPNLQPERATTQDSEVGFAASIAGSYAGEVSGAGALVFLPQAGFEKQGYFFLADGRGIRSHGVTFVLPRGTTPGRYALESPPPMDIGTVASVRVDRDMGDAVLSAEKNTTGYLDLVAFPGDGNTLSGAPVKGSFDFDTEDKMGQKITVQGEFSFAAN